MRSQDRAPRPPVPLPPAYGSGGALTLLLAWRCSDRLSRKQHQDITIAGERYAAEASLLLDLRSVSPDSLARLDRQAAAILN